MNKSCRGMSLRNKSLLRNVQKDNLFSFRIAPLLIIRFVNVGDFHTASVVLSCVTVLEFYQLIDATHYAVSKASLSSTCLISSKACLMFPFGKRICPSPLIFEN